MVQPIYEKDFFREVILPLQHNASGKTIGFAGRVPNNQQVAKYVNSPETEVYNKVKPVWFAPPDKELETQYGTFAVIPTSRNNSRTDQSIASQVHHFMKSRRYHKRFTENTILYDGDWHTSALCA